MLIRTPHTSKAGYYRNDDTVSGGKRTEADVQTCKHCQKILLMQHWKEEGGWCGRCNAPVCSWCSDRMLYYGCEPFLKKIEIYSDMIVKMTEFRKQAGLDQPAPLPAIIVPVGR